MGFSSPHLTPNRFLKNKKQNTNTWVQPHLMDTVGHDSMEAQQTVKQRIRGRKLIPPSYEAFFLNPNNLVPAGCKDILKSEGVGVGSCFPRNWRESAFSERSFTLLLCLPLLGSLMSTHLTQLIGQVDFRTIQTRVFSVCRCLSPAVRSHREAVSLRKAAKAQHLLR